LNPNGNGKQAPHGPETHGLTTLKRTVNRLGSRAIDRRTRIGKALSGFRRDLIQDVGGREALSTQQAVLIDLCVKTKLLLDSVDSWLLQQPSLINKRRKSILPVVRERQALADGLMRYLVALGLERRIKSLSLEEQLNEAD